MVRILICEDDARFRRLLSQMLTAVEGFQVDAVGTGEDACARVRREAPDVLVLDLELPGIDGLAVLDELRAMGAATVEVLVLTSFDDELRVFEAMKKGAAGYLVKGAEPRRLEQSICEVVRGGTVIDARIARRFWNHFASVSGKQPRQFGLTPEEIEVLCLIARGLSNPEAATVLGASTRSIKAHLEQIYRKMGVHGRVEATVAALRAGLISL
jgi:DNA-binding NarL/FixJ family response regulator